MWARGILTSNAFNNAGEVTSVTYSTNGNTLSFGFDRQGRRQFITNGSEVTSITYNEAGQMATEGYSGGTLSGFTVSNNFNSLLQRTNFVLRQSSSSLMSIDYAYEGGRLKTVTFGSNGCETKFFR